MRMKLMEIKIEANSARVRSRVRWKYIDCDKKYIDCDKKVSVDIKSVFKIQKKVAN